MLKEDDPLIATISIDSEIETNIITTTQTYLMSKLFTNFSTFIKLVIAQMMVLSC